MNDDPTPILWAPCLGKSKEYLHHCAYIRVPTQYYENELKLNGAEGDSQRPCLGSHLLGSVDDENGDLLHEALPSSASPAVGFDLRDKTGEQKGMHRIITEFDNACEEEKKLNKEAIRDVVQDLPKEERDEVCKEPVKPPEECQNVVRHLTVSDCRTSTRTIQYHPAETSQVCVSKVPCGCDNHITYIPKITEGVPEPTCTVETVPIKKVSIVTECTTNIDPDYVRRYIASFLRTHPEKDKILRLATAIERRRIEGYNFWDPKSLRLFVRRYTKGHPKKAIFLVGGGPGKTGYDLNCLIETYACWLKNNYVLYVIHPRGTGNSSRIPTGLNLTDSMLNPAIYISEMYHPFFAFTVTNSAMDVYNVFQREKMETHYSQIKWYIHACSYGTLVAQRLMVLKPDELDGVILDGVISPNPNVSRSLLDFGHRNNEILKNCMRNDHCRRRIKSVDNFINIFHRAEKQKTRCARFIAGMFPDSISYKRFIRSIMNYYFEKNEVVGVQFAYALGKCPNYSHFVKFVQANLACWMAYVRCDPLDMHPILFSIIMQSEIVGKRMLIHDSRYRELGKITCSRDMVGMGRKTFSPFNYMLDKSAHEYAFNHKTAVLILQGRLDGVTPVDNSTDVYQKSNPKISKMVIFENEGHTVSCSGSPCLDTLMKEFYDVPMSMDTIPSDECLRTVNMGTLNFEGWEQNLWFGWDWLLWLILVLIILVLIIVLVYFIYRYLKKRNQ